MDNRFDIGTILKKKDNRKVFIRIADVYEEDGPEHDQYWYEVETWNDNAQMWAPNATAPEGYIEKMYEVPDRLTLLVKFGNHNE